MDRNLFTYELTVQGALVAEIDVRIEYQGRGFDWRVELYDYNNKQFVKAPRDWRDNIMTWAWAKHEDSLREQMREHHVSDRPRKLGAVA